MSQIQSVKKSKFTLVKMSGRKVIFTCRVNITISDLKDLIAIKDGLPPFQQKLLLEYPKSNGSCGLIYLKDPNMYLNDYLQNYLIDDTSKCSIHLTL